MPCDSTAYWYKYILRRLSTGFEKTFKKLLHLEKFRNNLKLEELPPNGGNFFQIRAIFRTIGIFGKFQIETIDLS